MSVRRTAVEAVRIAGRASEVRAACAGTYGDEDEDEGREENGGEELRGRGNGGPAVRCCVLVAIISLTRGVRRITRDAVKRARIDRVRDGLVLLFERGRVLRCGRCDYWRAWNGGGREEWVFCGSPG